MTRKFKKLLRSLLRTTSCVVYVAAQRKRILKRWKKKTFLINQIFCLLSKSIHSKKKRENNCWLPLLECRIISTSDSRLSVLDFFSFLFFLKKKKKKKITHRAGFPLEQLFNPTAMLSLWWWWRWHCWQSGLSLQLEQLVLLQGQRCCLCCGYPSSL